MLFTYTPTEQTEEVIEQVGLLAREAARQRGLGLNWSKKSNNNFLFSFASSWCRELTVNQILGLIGPLPPGKLNIYGIRKHSMNWSNQPRNTVGEIGEPNEWVNTLFTNLFEFMTEMFSYILETEQPVVSHTPGYWLRRLANNDQYRLVGTKRPVGQPEWLLNLDKEAIPETPLWETDVMYGTMYNIPSEWAKSQGIMSYLLYLPRIWGAFYEDTNLLARLSKLGRLKYNSGGLAKLLYPGEEVDRNNPHPSIDMLRHIVKRLMLPMWFTEYGRMDFWTFTYLIIREGLAVQTDSPRIPGLLEALTSIDCSGFMSWVREYKCRPAHDAPSWVSGLHGMLQERGPYAMLKTKAITKYI